MIMDDFPDFPFHTHTQPSHQQLYSRIQESCRYTWSLLGEEEIDGVRLKTLGDQLEAALEDVELFSHTSIPDDWVVSLTQFVQQLLVRVRDVQGALLEECVFMAVSSMRC